MVLLPVPIKPVRIIFLVDGKLVMVG